MRRLFVVVALAVAMLATAAPAEASIYCRVLDKLGYEFVRECEGPVA